MADTQAERAAVAAEITAMSGTPILFERFGGRDDDAQRAYVSEVDRSDAYIGIYAKRYGRIGTDGLSATHAEYRRAQTQGKAILAWVAEGPAADGRDTQLDAFIQEARGLHTTGTYRTPEDLARQFHDAVASLAAEDVSPWVKLGDLVFRATTVRLGRDAGRIEAHLRPGPVLDRLNALLGDGNRRCESVLTVRERSMPVSIRDVTTTMESGTRTAVTIEFTLGEQHTPLGSAFSSGGASFTADEIVALRLRQQLFGETVVDGFFYYWCDFEIDLSHLRRTDLPESTTVALTRLLITEALIGGGYVGAIRRIDVAPLRAEGRRVAVTWTDRKVYINVEPASRSIEGIIPSVVHS